MNALCAKTKMPARAVLTGFSWEDCDGDASQAPDTDTHPPAHQRQEEIGRYQGGVNRVHTGWLLPIEGRA